MMNKTFQISNKVEELEFVYGQVELAGEEWELPQKMIMHLNMVLEEIISNIILYGYKDQDKHEIVIQLEKNNTVVSLQIEDDAVPFNPLESAAPDLEKPVEEREVGGLGIHFILSLMDKVTYEHKGDKNILRLMKSM